MPSQIDVRAELKAATDAVVASKSPKKLVVAGPGAGKTYLFKELLKAAPGNQKQRLVLTFINTLKGDLERNLGDASEVFTLHGYCQYLLRRNKNLRRGLTENFRCYPGLRRMIPQDWKFLRGTNPPTFIQKMRDLTCSEDERDFYLDRTDYYDAIDFDDSVYRAHLRMADSEADVPEYELVLIDEFQDFNQMEASVIGALGQKNSIVIAGDDDQALYSQLRGASWDHIRAHYTEGHYEIFELPFCMRCPEVVVGAVNDIIETAQKRQNLSGRIPKPYRYYEPIKGEDSRNFPHIDIVGTSVQRTNANYFGRYIEKCIRAIPQTDIDAAIAANEPAVLVIGSNPYRDSVEKYLIGAGLLMAKADDEVLDREKALQILFEDPMSNLGWRIILAVGSQDTAYTRIREANEKKCPLVEVISKEQRDSVLAEAKAWAAAHDPSDIGEEKEEPFQNVAITSYEGSKGRSAQYVFLIGAHAGELPKSSQAIQDIEICRFLVGLTRTKKKCSILYAKNAMGEFKKPSDFLSWISSARLNSVKVDAAYWNK